VGLGGEEGAYQIGQASTHLTHQAAIKVAQLVTFESNPTRGSLRNRGTSRVFSSVLPGTSLQISERKMQLNKERQRKIRIMLHRSFPKEDSPEFEL
jgi:hypothetical protein